MTEQWTIEENTPNGEYVMHRDFEPGDDVFIAVNQVEGGYELRIQAASPEDVLPDQVKGPFTTLEEAKAAAHAECAKWDADKGEKEDKDHPEKRVDEDGTSAAR